MDTARFKSLGGRLLTLCVFRELLDDPVIKSVCELLNSSWDGTNTASLYCEFCSRLYKRNGGDIYGCVEQLVFDSENVYVRKIGKNMPPDEAVKKSLERELLILGELCSLDSGELIAAIGCEYGLPGFISNSKSGDAGDLPAAYMHRLENIRKYGYGRYSHHPMFTIGEGGEILPVKNPDGIRLEELAEYELQKNQILENTKALLEGRPAANILLAGDAGTGKSSTIKAGANELYPEGLRIIEVRKDQLGFIPGLLDELAENPLCFILFIDDLSFLSDDDDFNGLKAVLEGSVSARSRNVVVYATSNRRHIVRERFEDREGGEVHRNDAMQEMISLSDRFGLHILFSRPDKKTYLSIVAKLCHSAGLDPDSPDIQAEAERFALMRGGRSARLARQFVDSLIAGQG